MRQLLIGALALTVAATTTPAQKIDTETASREHVVRVQTAMNHLTVIEVAEPVTTVAVGSPQAFRVERRENKVLIEPLQENVATNLFIWTASTRLNYELVPGGERRRSNGFCDRLPPISTSPGQFRRQSRGRSRPRRPVSSVPRNAAKQYANSNGWWIDSDERQPGRTDPRRVS